MANEVELEGAKSKLVKVSRSAKPVKGAASTLKYLQPRLRGIDPKPA
jgi:hypothetical protein